MSLALNNRALMLTFYLNKRVKIALDCSPEFNIACRSDGVTGLREDEIFFLFLTLAAILFIEVEPF